MLTSQDVHTIRDLFKEQFSNALELMTNRMDARFAEFSEIVTDQLEQQRLWFFKQTTQFKDDILKELIPLRLDYDILARKVSEHTEQIGLLDTRVTKLEIHKHN